MEFFIPAPSNHIKKERDKARELRQSQWWKRKLTEGRCYHCGGTFSPQLLTMDHLIPVVRGGHSDKNNLVTSCKDCNSKKGYRVPGEL
jgi:5-methylcytosine-specific restriction protein A